MSNRSLSALLKLPQPWKEPWKGYGLALATLTISAILRLGLDSWLPRGDLIVFAPAVAITVLFAGLGPGILTALLSGAVIWYFFLPPTHSFSLSLDGAVMLATYFLATAILLVLIHSLRLAIAELAEEKAHSDALAEREKLLTRELRHRTKNLFAVVEGLAIKSLDGGHSLAEAKNAFLGRLAALSRADECLLSADRKGILLSELVKSELRPFAGRITISGSDVTLFGQAAQNFALATHELATNALKYGALSTPSGTVEVGWSLKGDVDRILTFRWKERGTRPERPKRKGFGTVLLNATLGATRLDYEADGLLYEVDVHLDGEDSAKPRVLRSTGLADRVVAVPAASGSNLIH
jgi:two-component sensor histidine kinase